jgi:hypothetical protein
VAVDAAESNSVVGVVVAPSTSTKPVLVGDWPLEAQLHITPSAQKGPKKTPRYFFIAKGNKTLCPAQKQ